MPKAEEATMKGLHSGPWRSNPVLSFEHNNLKAKPCYIGLWTGMDHMRGSVLVSPSYGRARHRCYIHMREGLASSSKKPTGGTATLLLHTVQCFLFFVPFCSIHGCLNFIKKASLPTYIGPCLAHPSGQSSFPPLCIQVSSPTFQRNLHYAPLQSIISCVCHCLRRCDCMW
jgi:hypothetical protein